MAIDTKADSGPAVRRRAAPWASLSAPVVPAALLFLGTLALYGATRTDANTFDAVSYANQIAHLYPRTGDPRWLFHPHHLLFNALGYGLWRLAQACGFRGGSLAVLQSLNAALGAAGVSLYYLTLRRLLQRSRFLPLLLAVGLAFSFGYWICATDGRVNMPSVFLLLAALAALCRLMQSPGPARAALAGLLAGGAVLFHESAGLFVVVGLVGALLADPAAGARRGRLTGAFLGAWAATAVLPYLAVGVLVLHLRSLSAFRRWSSEYAELGWWWDFRVLHNLGRDFYAFRHALFVEPGGSAGTFTLGHGVPPLLLALYAASLLGWLGMAYAAVAALPQLWRSHNRRLMIVLAVWALAYAAFFTVWSPGYFVFWVPVLIPSSLLLALVLAHYRAGRGGAAVPWVLGAWVAMYAALNLEASILPHLGAGSDPFRRVAADVRAHTRPGDIVLVAGAGDGGPCEVALPYFADRDVISLHGLLTKSRGDKAAALDAARSGMDTALASGHAVYALDEVIPAPRSRRTLAALAAKHRLTAADERALLLPYLRALAWTGPRGPVWRLTPRPAPPAPPPGATGAVP